MTKVILFLLLSAPCVLAQTGSLDYSIVIGAGANARVTCIVPDGSGNHLLGGEFSKFNGADIARLNNDGT
jgi:hypothetical protein